ncbi:MAG TPA: hypothetical protein PKE39_04385 [Ignavibacteria bacterium]|nr:hypothetical protein [Ignavibacteria bacterium]HMQ98240.1 hypothetical protein [Ignavibacteria bacterium]
MTDGLFPNKEPNYKPHLRQSGTITDFKSFEQSLQELRFCKNKLSEVRVKKARAALIATKPFLEEEQLLEKQVEDMQGNIDVYLNQNMETQADLINNLPDVKIEEVHKFKIKFTKESKKNAA